MLAVVERRRERETARYLTSSPAYSAGRWEVEDDREESIGGECAAAVLGDSFAHTTVRTSWEESVVRTDNSCRAGHGSSRVEPKPGGWFALRRSTP